jgi:hypothetical protein
MAMAGLAQWLAGRRVSRVALMALLFPVPLLAVITAALVVLATIARGWRVAAEDSACAAALLAVGTALAGGFWLEISLGAALTWALAVVLAHLRRIGSLTLAVQVAVLMGVCGALAFMAWSPNPQAYWEQVLKELATRAKSAGMDVGPEVLTGAAQMMTGVMSASVVASAVAALFIGCWWAGQIGGGLFGAEFRELRMGRVLGLIAGVIGLLFLTAARPTADDLLLVLGTGFVLQGLAVVHWHGARRAWPKGWPLLLYMPLGLLPALAGLELSLLALLGLLDNGYSLRRPAGKVV